MMMNLKERFIHDNFQNFKQYRIPKAQLIIADIPYNIGNFAYGSNPSWYVGGDNKNGESDKAGKTFFYRDVNFNIAEFMHFASKMMIKEPKEVGKAPCMIVFCEFEQQFGLIELARKHGINNYINLVFRKNYSAQVLKANMRIVGNCEYGLLLYRDKLPKYNNNGRMIFNCIDFPRLKRNKVHPTQKPLSLLHFLIRTFTDPGDVVIDPCAGSGSTIRAAMETDREGFGFEVDRKMYHKAVNEMFNDLQPQLI